MLWAFFLADYPLTRDVYFTVALLHVLAEVPFLLRAPCRTTFTHGTGQLWSFLLVGYACRSRSKHPCCCSACRPVIRSGIGCSRASG